MGTEDGQLVQPPQSERPARRVLGDVSPNVRATIQLTGSALIKPLNGSPLKRSFTAAMEGQGFTYFKKRKLSMDTPLSEQVFNVRPSSTPAMQASSGYEVEALIPTIEHPSPTEPNTPTDFADGEEPDSSADRRSFSSLINYDLSSQTGSNIQRPAKCLFNGPSYAELLRIRLRVAMYKVRTDQVNVPFAELREECDTEPPGPSRPEALDSKTMLRDPPFGKSDRSEDLSSARLAALRSTSGSDWNGADTSLPPSPLPALSASRLPELSTPEGVGRFHRPDDAELTSSIVKGQGAEALLGLRNAC